MNLKISSKKIKNSKFSQNAQNYEECEKIQNRSYKFTKTKLWSKLNEETMVRCKSDLKMINLRHYKTQPLCGW